MANLKDCPKFETFDDYYTPKEAWEKINHLIPKDKVVWEAFMLGSNQSKSIKNLKEMKVNVIGNTEWDFLKETPEHDLIISNPPFSNPLKTLCLKKLVENDKPFIIIMNSMNLFSVYFNRLFLIFLNFVRFRWIFMYCHKFDGCSWMSIDFLSFS